MNLKEVLQMADEIVFAKTGEHLDDLQEAILRGTLQGEKYSQIAEESHSNESYVRDVGSKLWRILSEELGEKISKSNIRSTMERLQNSNVLTFAQDVVVSGSFNICGKPRHPPDTPNSHSPNPEISHQDLSEMPELGAFYNRTSQLETLTTWILQHHTRIVALTGIGGIGKTTLAVQLVQQIKDEFEYVIWCNLDEPYTLDELQHRLIQFFLQPENPDSTETNPKPLPLIKYIQKHRCLIVIDDIHNFFSHGELAGKYKPEYENYRAFFKQIEQLSHQSCFLVIGWEHPREVAEVRRSNVPIYILQLQGLDLAAGRDILKGYGLAEIENWEAIVRCYQGNPFWLKSVATLVRELGITVTEVLPDDTILLPEDLKDSLQEQVSRLSPIEKQVLSILAKESAPINLAKLLEFGIMPSVDFLNALQSLSRRSLIEKSGSCYDVSRVLRQYVKAYL
ncbi:MAG TPA: AAA family ATPase [Oscillatoriales cyanobacterium M59_W2019_021]|nr:AAA family ATPase [Oscillatoriales cyanobacterium M4454_W2019_049]HIK52892.1 AAA family ATPase [Oscillatoriales cyanobacterium M59_W2019_021]